MRKYTAASNWPTCRRLLLLSVVRFSCGSAARLPRLSPPYGVNTPYAHRARLGKKHAHNRFWLDGRRVTWPLQRAAFPKAALFIMVGEHPSCAVALWWEIKSGIKGVVFFIVEVAQPRWAALVLAPSQKRLNSYTGLVPVLW